MKNTTLRIYAKYFRVSRIFESFEIKIIIWWVLHQNFIFFFFIDIQLIRKLITRLHVFFSKSNINCFYKINVKRTFAKIQFSSFVCRNISLFHFLTRFVFFSRFSSSSSSFLRFVFATMKIFWVSIDCHWLYIWLVKNWIENKNSKKKKSSDKKKWT